MKLPDIPELSYANKLMELQNSLDNYEPYSPEEEIKEAIQNQSDVLLDEMKRQTDIHEKQLNNQVIKIEQHESLINEVKSNGKTSTRLSIIAIIVAIASLIVAVISIVIK